MRRIAALAFALGLFAVAAPAEELRFTVMSGFDLDGEAADADQVVTAANGVLADAGNYVLTANPDVCRLLDITVADTNLSAGTLTVAGTGCLDEARSCVFAFTAGDDTGVKTLTCTDGEGAYFKTVTGVTNGALTGEDVETFTLGYTSNSANGWRVYGQAAPAGPIGENGVNVLASALVVLPITTSNVLTTAVTSVAANAAFTDILAGDLLLINQTDSSGVVQTYERTVVSRADADNIVVNSAILIPSAGVAFRWKRPYFSTNPYDQLWIPVGGYKTVAFNYSVSAAGINTGGTVATLECLDSAGPGFPTSGWDEMDTVTTATTTALAATMETLGPVVLSELPYSWCRVGMKFGTGDDDDTGTESISLSVSLSK